MSIEAMNCVWTHAPAASGKFTVLLALADYADENASCFPSIASLARKARLRERQAQNCLRDLEQDGLVRVLVGAGPRGCNRYVLDLAEIERRSIRKPAATGGAGGAGDTDSVQAEGEGGANIAPPVEPEPGVQSAAPGGAVECTGGVQSAAPESTKEPPKNPSLERERAGAGHDGLGETENSGETENQGETENPECDQPDTGDDADKPATAAFEKRVQRLCNGRGFAAGPWRDWDTASLGWIVRQFARLDPEARAAAERWRDAYLLDLAARRKTPQPIGTWLRDRVWEALDPEILVAAERRKAEQVPPGERAKPEGWAPCLGPVGMAWLLARLLAGPATDEEPRLLPDGAPFFVTSELQRIWPDVWRWQQLNAARGGAVFADRWHALAATMEPVPAGSATRGDWRDAFNARLWPWPNVFDRIDVVWLPKGGPTGLDAFAAAVMEADDAAQREAAQ